MSGRRLTGWRFKGRMPLWFKLTSGVLIANSLLHFGLFWTVSSWAQARPDATHSYRLPFRDGSIYFATGWVGWYVDAWWISVVVFVVLVALLVLNRDQLEQSAAS